jgi:hypothetical protein
VIEAAITGGQRFTSVKRSAHTAVRIARRRAAPSRKIRLCPKMKE